jgi:WXG100 family type VII secretion target
MAIGGAGDPSDFTIDVDDLDEVVHDLAKCEAALSTLTDDLEHQMAALHGVWEGLSAQAYREAHDEWTTGMLAMRAALADLRAAARLAHSHYTGAAQTNVDM